MNQENEKLQADYDLLLKRYRRREEIISTLREAAKEALSRLRFYDGTATILNHDKDTMEQLEAAIKMAESGDKAVAEGDVQIVTERTICRSSEQLERLMLQCWTVVTECTRRREWVLERPNLINFDFHETAK